MRLKRIIDYVKNNWIPLLITAIISIIISLLVGYFFLFQGQEKVDIRHQVHKFPFLLAQNKALNKQVRISINNLEIKDKDIENTKITFINRGNKELNYDDLSKSYPPIITIDDNVYLVSIADETPGDIGAKLVKKDNHTYIVEFQYLASGQKLVIDVLAKPKANIGYSVTGKHIKKVPLEKQFSWVVLTSSGSDTLVGKILFFMVKNLSFVTALNFLMLLIMLILFIMPKRCPYSIKKDKLMQNYIEMEQKCKMIQELIDADEGKDV